MRSPLPTLAVLATISSCILAQTTSTPAATVTNLCPFPVYLTINRPSQFGTPLAIPSYNGSYTEPLSGMGNSFGVSKTAAFFSTDTRKLIFGWSVDASSGLVYYSAAYVDGVVFPVRGFNISSADAGCAAITGASTVTEVCESGEGLTLITC